MFSVCSYIVSMQIYFDFAVPSHNLPLLRDRLRRAFAGYQPHNIREPIGQLVKSMISSRTKDGVSLRCYEKLVGRYRSWQDVAAASLSDIHEVIRDVTFAPEKTEHLKEALRRVALVSPDFDFSWLKLRSVPQALAWLETLPGVGRKVAASALNFSTLAMPAFVVDTHVIRVLSRFGIVGERADTVTVYEAVMASVPDWTAYELSEFHVLVKRLGQTLCRFEHAACRQCPLSQSCRHAGSRPAAPPANGIAQRPERPPA